MSHAARRLEVDLADRSYTIHMVSGLPDVSVSEAVTACRRAMGPGRALVVTDHNVGPLYADGVVEALVASGHRVEVLELPAGEDVKSMEGLSAVIDAALAHGVGRRDALVALGGGVIGDLTGFAAAVLHRGVSVVQVPTSLLAQVDSAVGGKTAINHSRGKNLVGAFWQPAAVISSAAVLRTLPDRERRCGLAEALKHGLIADARLVRRWEQEADDLSALEDEPIADLVEACCRIKAAVVASDEREAGGREVLNFGHTFGHAYERILGYGRLTHGEAVALGMVLAARLSETLGMAGPGLATQVAALLGRFGLPYEPEAEGLPTMAELLEAARHDKKGDGEHIRFVLLRAVGEAQIERLTWDEIQRAFA